MLNQKHVESLKIIPWPLHRRKDKRSAPRRDIYMSIQYRVRHYEPYRETMLLNLSQTGLLIFISERLSLRTPVTFIISPDKTTSGEPIRVIATIIREASHTDDGCHTYGCRILCISDPN